MQGAGKVQTFEAVTSTLAIVPATMSLGEVLVAKEKTTKKSFTLKNISDSDVTVELKFQGHSNITVSMPTTVIIEAGSEQSVEAKIVQKIFHSCLVCETNNNKSPLRSLRTPRYLDQWEAFQKYETVRIR